ncbi:trypsin-like peptidase domain-containing protein [Glutamicibacter ardleyensis]|uniref:trypsin-like peptidase domain-containing protein n=1 Tax=Glutamicibacter ardleyensis TaxID=225894 RepID=UPI003FD2E6C1
MTGWEQRVLSATVEILDERGKLIGSGMLIDEARVLTAAHVIRNKNGPLPMVSVRFATDIVHGCIVVIPGEADVAVVNLPEELAFSPPVPVTVVALERRRPEYASVLGFPVEDSTSKGIWCAFRVRGPIGARGEYRQLDWNNSRGSFKGHSGGPVVDDSTGEMIGILTESSTAGQFDRFLGMQAISTLVDGLSARWVFSGEEARAHVTRRAHGHLSNGARGGDFFTGREAALAKVREWLDTGHQVGRPLVITGQPGAGKSAVLGRAALKQEARGLQAGLFFHARSATYEEFLDAVREAIDLTPEEDVLEGLRQHVPARGLAVMVDALDEAATRRDAERIAGTLAGMAGVSQVAVVVATRPGGASRAPDPGTFLALLNVPSPLAPSLVDLDSDFYFDPKALTKYAADLLCQDGADCPYPADGAWPDYRRDRKLTHRLAKAITDRSGANYLVAALTAVSLSENLPVLDPSASGFDPQQLPTKVGEALQKVIDRQTEPMASLTRGLLTALAYAEGSGIPDDLWLAFAKALHYEVGPASLRDLKASGVADFLLQGSSDHAGKVTRLFHQALADELLGPNPERSEADAIFQTILNHIREGRGWARSDDYEVAHAPTYALKAGRLADLLRDSDALGHCNPALLISVVLDDETARKSPIGLAVIFSASHLTRVPPGRERLALLSLAGTHLGLDLSLGKIASTGWSLTWAHSSGRHHQKLPSTHNGPVRAVALGRLSGRDIIVSAGEDGTVRRWDEHGDAVGEPSEGHHGPVRAVALGRLSGRDIIVSAGEDGTVRCWNEHGDPVGDPVGIPVREPSKGHQGAVLAVTLGRLSGRDIIVSAGEDGTVRRWDKHGAAVGKPSEGHQGAVLAVTLGRLSGRDIIVSAGEDGTVRCWNEHGAAVGEPLEGHQGAVLAVTVGRLSGRDIIVSAGLDETVRRWDEHGDAVGKPSEGHHGPVRAVALGRLSGRDIIVSAGEDGTVRCWNEHGDPVGDPMEDHQGAVLAVEMGQLGGRGVIVSAGKDRTVRCWDEHGAPDGKPKKGHREWVLAVEMGQLGGRGVIVSAGWDGTVCRWDEHGDAVGEPSEGHQGPVRAVALGRLSGRDIIVSAGEDGTVRRWDEHGDAVGEPSEGHQGAVLAVALGRLSGRDIIVSAGLDGTVRRWDEHGDPVGKPSEGHQGAVLAVALGRLSDRDIIISAGLDGTVRRWDEHGALLGGPLENHQGAVLAVALGRLSGRDVIISAGLDETVRCWDEHGDPVGDPLTLLMAVPALALSNSVLAVATGRAIARFKWI